MQCEECTLDGNAVKLYLPLQMQYPCLLVGQAPGKTEVITGVPFTGGAGKMLWSLMKEAGLFKNQFPQTNLVQCKPPSDNKGNDRPPTSLEVKSCFKHLFEEIQDLQPELIIAFGGPAMLALTGREGPMSLRGSFHPLLDIYQHECQVLCLLHPSFVMRQRQWVNIAVNDLRLIHKFFLEGVPSEKEYLFTLDPILNELEDYLFNNKEVTSFDIETTSLDPFEAQVLGIGFARDEYSSMTVYFTQSDDRLELIKRWLEDDTYKKVAQNGSYDCKVLECSLNIKVSGMTFDTRLAEQILNSDMPKNLDHLRAAYTSIRPYKPAKADMKVMSAWDKDKMLEYCCWDNVTTLQVMKAQNKLLTETQKELQETLLVPLIKTINYMELKGVNVDVNRLALMYAKAVPVAQAIEEFLWNEYHLNPNSPKQVKEFFNINGSSRTELEDLVRHGHEKSEVIEQILQYRDLTKGSGTFLKGVYERLKDGRIHTQYNIEGTGTGRLSSENPNLQNVPKPFRIIYTADTEDDVLISSDFKQLELWTVALLGPCPPLLKILQDGGDIHASVEKPMIPYMPERLLRNSRMIAKSLVFGTLYGLSARTIAVTHGVSIDTAKTWQGIFLDVAGLDKYYEDRREDFKRGYTETPWGRRRYIQTFPQALNGPVQSSASDTCLSKLNQCYYEGGLDLRLQVHDEIVIHSSRKDMKKNALLLKEIMESPVRQMFNFKFKVDVKCGYNWYEMERMEL